MRSRSATSLIAAVVVLLAAPGAALGQQNPPPNTFEDGFDNFGCTVDNCTLREAVETALAGETIVLSPGTYTLSLGFPITPEADVTIAGAGARATTISGGSLTKVLDIGLEETDVTLRGVTVTGGNGAGGQFPQQGGAIFVFQDASLTVEDSTIVGNRAATGGGIYSRGALTLNRTTVSGNVATGLGGGVWGGDVELGGSVSIASSTVSGNSASGGGGVAAASVTIARSTIAGNTADRGAGLFKQSGAPATIDDTIIAAATPNVCAQLTAVDGSHNLSSDTTCPFERTNVDPLLGPLQDNGGSTNTHALLAGSPAIGAANPLMCTGTDQRGVVRPQQGTCDIGAFEYIAPPAQPQPGPPPPPPTEGEEQLPPPVAGRTLNALPKSGRVRVKLPGRRKYVRLREGQQVPVGTVFDTRKGHVTLVAAANRRGGTATSEFWAGVFRLGQTAGRRPRTSLTLTERLSCGNAAKAGTAAKKKKRNKRRRLWGNGRGRFRTKGKHSAATVVGTKWLVQDRCTSTVTRVVRGRVKVRDFVKKKTVTVRKGNRYVARAKR